MKEHKKLATHIGRLLLAWTWQDTESQRCNKINHSVNEQRHSGCRRCIFALNQEREWSLTMKKERILPSLLAIGLITGCNIDVDGIKQGADDLKQKVESSNLKDCKDDDGNPLPKWVCRTDQTNDDKENWLLTNFESGKIPWKTINHHDLRC